MNSRLTTFKTSSMRLLLPIIFTKQNKNGRNYKEYIVLYRQLKNPVRGMCTPSRVRLFIFMERTMMNNRKLTEQAINQIYASFTQNEVSNFSNNFTLYLVLIIATVTVERQNWLLGQRVSTRVNSALRLAFLLSLMELPGYSYNRLTVCFSNGIDRKNM